MGLNDLGDDAKESAKERKTEELKDRLGVESKEELEELDGRLVNAVQNSIANDKRIEELEDQVKFLETAIKRLIDEVLDEEEENNGGDDGPTWGT